MAQLYGLGCSHHRQPHWNQSHQLTWARQVVLGRRRAQGHAQAVRVLERVREEDAQQCHRLAVLGALPREAVGHGQSRCGVQAWRQQCATAGLHVGAAGHAALPEQALGERDYTALPQVALFVGQSEMVEHLALVLAQSTQHILYSRTVWTLFLPSMHSASKIKPATRPKVR